MPTNEKIGHARLYRKRKKLKKKVSLPDRIVHIRVATRLFGALLRQIGCPLLAVHKYKNILYRRLLFEGFGFLKLTRQLPTLGVRILGKDVKPGNGDSFRGFKVKINSDGYCFPKFLSFVWNELYRLSNLKATPALAVYAKRLISVLSFSKMLTFSSKRALRAAKIAYENRIHKTYGRLEYWYVKPAYEQHRNSLEDYLRSINFQKTENRLRFDPQSYSLKGISKFKPYPIKIPRVWGLPQVIIDPAGNVRRDRSSMAVDCGPFLGTFEGVADTMPFIDHPYYYDSFLLDDSSYDGRLGLILEKAGKLRGICPYLNPLVHSINLYRLACEARRKSPVDCMDDQTKGHEVARRLSMRPGVVTSSDASDFTDNIDPALLVLLTDLLGCPGAIHYISELRVLGCKSGKVMKSGIPLMGFKGTLDTASILLQYSMWKHRIKAGKHALLVAQCGDDLVGPGTYEDYERVYGEIGVPLNRNKTVVSETVAVFCGKFFWSGFDISPVRLDLSGIFMVNKLPGQVFQKVRDFIIRCDYAKHAKRTFFMEIKKALGIYRHSICFDLPGKLGGVPINVKLGPKSKLLDVLNLRFAYRTALSFLKTNREEPDAFGRLFGLFRLGYPTWYGGEGTKVAWPVTKLVLRKRKYKMLMRAGFGNPKVGVPAILEFYFFDGVLQL